MSCHLLIHRFVSSCPLLQAGGGTRDTSGTLSGGLMLTGGLCVPRAVASLSGLRGIASGLLQARKLLQKSFLVPLGPLLACGPAARALELGFWWSGPLAVRAFV